VRVAYPGDRTAGGRLRRPGGQRPAAARYREGERSCGNHWSSSTILGPRTGTC